MKPIGLICNPQSMRNQKDSSLGTLGRRLPDILFAQPATPEELGDVMQDFACRGVETVGIAGGDGTIRNVLTALSRIEGYRPDLALIPAGKTNLASLALGSAGPGPGGLLRLMDALRSGLARRTLVPVLDIDWPDGGKRRVRGFLFAAGAFSAASEMANRRVHPFGIYDGAAIAVTLGLTALSLLCGGASALRKGQDITVAIDNGEASERNRFLLLATTLQGFLPRLNPFWGDGAGPLRWLDIAAPPQRLAAALVPTLRGKPAPWMEEAGYRSGKAQCLHVRLKASFIVDGEPFEAGPEGVVLSCTESVGFVLP